MENTERRSRELIHGGLFEAQAGSGPHLNAQNHQKLANIENLFEDQFRSEIDTECEEHPQRHHMNTQCTHNHDINPFGEPEMEEIENPENDQEHAFSDNSSTTSKEEKPLIDLEDTEEFPEGSNLYYLRNQPQSQQVTKTPKMQKNPFKQHPEHPPSFSALQLTLFLAPEPVQHVTNRPNQRGGPGGRNLPRRLRGTSGAQPASNRPQHQPREAYGASDFVYEPKFESRPTEDSGPPSVPKPKTGAR